MKPVIAIIGRPNVGKSTLFNALTRSQDALVADTPGLTRDRIFGDGHLGGRPYILVDTGGLTDGPALLPALVSQQALRAAAEADAVILVADARQGQNPADSTIAEKLRRLGKPVFLALNKTEGLDPDQAAADFYALGIGQPLLIASAHGQGLEALMEAVLAPFAHELPDPSAIPAGVIRLSVIGRPNVGKSTLINRMLGEDRMLVFDQPGTTRDSVATPLRRGGKDYLLIDTAGVRRRSHISQRIEKLSVIKALRAVERSDVALLLIDGREAVTDQDASLLGIMIERGRALVVAVNKWDGLDSSQRQRIRAEIERKLRFVGFAEIRYISALHGSGVGMLFPAIERAYASSVVRVATPELTRIVGEAVNKHPPPLVRGRRIKLRYAHMGGQQPPTVVIHGNQTDSVPDSYRRYLENAIRKALGLTGTPIRIAFRRAPNPYAE
ncbi:MAG: ribosome biogenesis GTPase Der [Gammaproteobacteria bacterium]